MNQTEFDRLTAQYGLSGFPGGLAPLFAVYAACYRLQPLMRREFLAALCRRFTAGDAAQSRLLAALDEIEADPNLLLLSNFLVQDMCAARRGTGWIWTITTRWSRKNVVHAELYSCLLLFACIEPSLQRLERIGVPKEDYEATPFYPAKRQLEKLRPPYRKPAAQSARLAVCRMDQTTWDGAPPVPARQMHS